MRRKNAVYYFHKSRYEPEIFKVFLNMQISQVMTSYSCTLNQSFIKYDEERHLSQVESEKFDSLH